MIPYLTPLTCALSLVLLGVLAAYCGRRRLGHAAILTGVAAAWLPAMPFCSYHIRGHLERRYPPVVIEHTPTVEVIVVLGGCVAPSRPLQLTADSRAVADLRAASDRLLHAARLYRAGKAPFVLLAGGAHRRDKEHVPEAVLMAELLYEWGVPREAMILDTLSLNTYQNMRETQRLLEEHRLHTMLLVTSALHMPRALRTFHKAGLDAIPSPTDFEVLERTHWRVLDWFPDAEALAGSTRALKEYFGLIVYGWRGWN